MRRYCDGSVAPVSRTHSSSVACSGHRIAGLAIRRARRSATICLCFSQAQANGFVLNSQPMARDPGSKVLARCSSRRGARSSCSTSISPALRTAPGPSRLWNGLAMNKRGRIQDASKIQKQGACYNYGLANTSCLAFRRRAAHPALPSNSLAFQGCYDLAWPKTNLRTAKDRYLGRWAAASMAGWRPAGSPRQLTLNRLRNKASVVCSSSCSVSFLNIRLLH